MNRAPRVNLLPRSLPSVSSLVRKKHNFYLSILTILTLLALIFNKQLLASFSEPDIKIFVEIDGKNFGTFDHIDGMDPVNENLGRQSVNNSYDSLKSHFQIDGTAPKNDLADGIDNISRIASESRSSQVTKYDKFKKSDRINHEAVKVTASGKKAASPSNTSKTVNFRHELNLRNRNGFLISFSRQFVSEPSLYFWANEFSKSYSNPKDIHLLYKSADGATLAVFALKLAYPIAWSLKSQESIAGGYHEDIQFSIQEISRQK